MIRRDAGFSLIEVLVSLTILSVAIGGLVLTGTQTVRATQGVSARTLAGFVADNEIARLRGSDDDLRARSGQAAQMGQSFDWALTVSETEQPGFFQIEVAVTPEGQEEPRVTRRAFIYRGTS